MSCAGEGRRSQTPRHPDQPWTLRQTWRSFEATSHTGPGAHRAGPPGHAGFCYWQTWGAICSRNWGDLWLCTTASCPGDGRRGHSSTGTPQPTAQSPGGARHPCRESQGGPRRQDPARRPAGFATTPRTGSGEAPAAKPPQGRGRLAVSTSAHRGRELHARTRWGRTRWGRTRGHGGPAPRPQRPPHGDHTRRRAPAAARQAALLLVTQPRARTLEGPRLC